MNDPSPAQVAAGTVLGGRYELTEPIASGGMAQVWQGRDVTLSRPVAVKLLHPHLATDQAFVLRFRREALAAARLSHPSIVAVYDTLSDGGFEAIVMELIEGRTLRDLLDEIHQLPPGNVVAIGIQIAAALDAAHRAGLVHRDIKPANIMMSSDQRVLVADFGIAKASQDDDLTQTGTLLGTAKYLAPEQVSGEALDGRVDLYALGVVLFEALTGGVPFLGSTDAATALARLREDPPRCHERRAGIPIDLDEVIAVAMARDPADRFDTAGSMGAALAAVDMERLHPGPGLTTYPPPAGPPSDPTPPSVPITAADPSGLPTVASSNPAYSATPTNPPTNPSNPSTGAPTQAIAPLPQPPPANGGPTGPPAPAGQSNTAILPQVPGPVAAGGRKGRRAAKARARSEAKAARRRKGRQRPTRVAALALGAGGLLLIALLLGALRNGSAPAAPRTPVAATPFDPLGTSGRNGAENDHLAPLAIDGDLDTAWRTEPYRRASLGGLKDGVGLILDLGGRRTVEGVELATGSDGWRIEVYVADAFEPDGREFDVGTYGEPVSVLTGDGGSDVEADWDRVEGGLVLLWVTETGVPVDNDARFQFILFEVSLL